VLALEYKPENTVFAEKNEVSGQKLQKPPGNTWVERPKPSDFSLARPSRPTTGPAA
jgi:hypothetical protein